MVHKYLSCVWLVFGATFWTCGVCVCVLWRAGKYFPARHNTHIHHRVSPELYCYFGIFRLQFGLHYIAHEPNIPPYLLQFGICRQTPTMHMINIYETLQVISVKVQVITPWWWILCDPKHGEILNYASFKLLYDTGFNI